MMRARRILRYPLALSKLRTISVLFPIFELNLRRTGRFKRFYFGKGVCCFSDVQKWNKWIWCVMRRKWVSYTVGGAGRLPRGDVRRYGRLGGDWRPLRSCEPRPGAFLLIVYATGDLKPLLITNFCLQLYHIIDLWIFTLMFYWCSLWVLFLFIIVYLWLDCQTETTNRIALLHNCTINHYTVLSSSWYTLFNWIITNCYCSLCQIKAFHFLVPVKKKFKEISTTNK